MYGQIKEVETIIFQIAYQRIRKNVIFHKVRLGLFFPEIEIFLSIGKNIGDSHFHFEIIKKFIHETVCFN